MGQRLIDADALKKENERLLHCDFPYLSEMTLEELIDEAPTIDAEPVRHGKWIWNDKCRRVCSVCENPVAFMLSMNGWHEGKYCPNCGCRMDEE